MSMTLRSFYVLSLASLACLAGRVVQADNILKVNQKMQEQDQWCWSASCQAVLEFYGINVSQTDLASYGTGGRNVPDYLWGSDSDAGYLKNGCDLILHNFGTVSSTGSAGTLTQPELLAEMDAASPVVINWNWSGTSNDHILVARGMKDGNVYLMDPYYGPTIGDYDWVANGLTQGSTHIWQGTLRIATDSSTIHGVPLWWLGKYNLNTGGSWSALALGDQDGDGVPTWEEYLADSVPTNRNSRFDLGIECVSGSSFERVLSWQSSSNRIYSLQWKTNLLSSVPWANVPGSTTLYGTGINMAVTNSETARSGYFKINASPRD